MKKTIAFVVATPLTANSFLLHHFKELSKIYDVYLIANFSGEKIFNFRFENVKTIDVPIQRKISLISDIKSLFILWGVFRKYKFFIVHSVTPKAGLIAMSSSMFAGIKYRFHIFTGQVWVNDTGLKRLALKTLDKITAFCSFRILVDSDSQRQFLIKERVICDKKSTVLADGSISGVNTQFFFPSKKYRKQLRKELGIAESDFVFLFLGRVGRAKGIVELVEAFASLSKEAVGKSIRLLIVGPDEENLLAEQKDTQIIVRGFTNTPNKYMAAADVFCLPSHREGFGSVIIEAAAAGLPTIGSNIYGITDAIQEHVTGLLHEVNDHSSIRECMRYVIDNAEITAGFSIAARKRAIKYFSHERLTSALIEFYSTVCKSN